MFLRKATEADIESLCGLYQKVSSSSYANTSRELVKQAVCSEQMYCLDSESGMQIAVKVETTLPPAYRDVNWLFGVRPAVFSSLAIHPALFKDDCIKEVLEAVEALSSSLGCDSIRCDAAVSDHCAEQFYLSLGMRKAGRFSYEDQSESFIGYEKRLDANCPLLPLNMHPAFRAGSLTPWGGDKLKIVFHKSIPDAHTGESLEVSCIPGLESTDDNDVKLTDLISTYGRQLVGRFEFASFPLLLKMIDARESLSVQVHPNDEYAHVHENGKLGKTEAWLILDAPEGAELVYGIQPGTTLAALEQASIEGASVEKLLRRVKVKAGDVCYIPAGCVHAIGAGIILYEIQQSSDITYRFYDWNRVDANGKGRELHLKQALAVTNLEFAPNPVSVPNIPVARVLDEKYFSLDILNPTARACVHVPHIRDFGLLTALTDGLTLVWEGVERKLSKGQTVFIPNSAPALALFGSGRAALSMPRCEN